MLTTLTAPPCRQDTFRIVTPIRSLSAALSGVLYRRPVLCLREHSLPLTTC